MGRDKVRKVYGYWSRRRVPLATAQLTWLYLFDPTITTAEICDRYDTTPGVLRSCAAIAMQCDHKRFLHTGLVWPWTHGRFPPWPTAKDKIFNQNSEEPQRSITPTLFARKYKYGGVIPPDLTLYMCNGPNRPGVKRTTRREMRPVLRLKLLAKLHRNRMDRLRARAVKNLKYRVKRKPDSKQKSAALHCNNEAPVKKAKPTPPSSAPRTSNSFSLHWMDSEVTFGDGQSYHQRPLADFTDVTKEQLFGEYDTSTPQNDHDWSTLLLSDDTGLTSDSATIQHLTECLGGSDACCENCVCGKDWTAQLTTSELAVAALSYPDFIELK